MAIRTPSSKASIAYATDQTGKLHAPSAERNAASICAIVQSVAPQSGEALEVASGTGQHVVALAAATPNISWQPTEVDAARIASIEAYMQESGLVNVASPVRLDATQVGWSNAVEPKDFVLLSNLLHLISDVEANTLISEAAKVLKPDGKLFLYGPFMRAGRLTSDGDTEFDANIRANDPETGYKNDEDIKFSAAAVGLTFFQATEMPANNLALVFQKRLPVS